jgi:dihydrolipoamide dehydrogenase
MHTDELLVAVGRKPNTKNLGLESVGLKSKEWLDVDDTGLVQEVEGDWLYAIGDINHRALLTHIGKYQARTCAAAILARAKGKAGDNTTLNVPFSRSAATADHHAVPQVIFTDPQIGAVGLTEQNAKSLEGHLNNNNNKKSVRAVDCDMSVIDGAKLHTDGYSGHAKIIVDEDRHVIIGATFIGPQVGELLHSATIAIVGEVPLDRLWHAIPSFPTVSEVWINLLENYGF